MFSPVELSTFILYVLTFACLHTRNLITADGEVSAAGGAEGYAAKFAPTVTVADTTDTPTTGRVRIDPVITDSPEAGAVGDAVRDGSCKSVTLVVVVSSPSFLPLFCFNRYARCVPTFSVQVAGTFTGPTTFTWY